MSSLKVISCQSAWVESTPPPDLESKKKPGLNRVKKERPQQYAFILPPSGLKPLCLTCDESVALVKSSNLKRHYETKLSKLESLF